MSCRDTIITALAALFFTPVVLLCISVTYAQTMQSTNYRIQSDSINIGGGFSSSTSYSLESTAGENATGDSDSASYGLRAGYQQMVNAFISMTAPATVLMTPSIPGVSGGYANGSTTVTVTTDSAGGYELSISSEQGPAMSKGGDSIADYVPAGDPDYTFTIDATDAYFGYSPSGVDTIARFKDDGASLCNTGSFETALACWDGLSTTQEPIARSTGGNMPNGATTTVNFRVGIGGAVVQPPGTYTATTTLTAIAL
jgi:hypothetical protein